MFKRAVRTSLAGRAIDIGEIEHATDGSMEALLAERDSSGLALALRERRLYKRALDLPASHVPDDLPAWLWSNPDRLERAEAALAVELELPPNGVLIDYPERASMLKVNLPLLTRDERTEQLTDAGRAGELGLPHVADELYRSARRLRIFTAKPRKLERIPEMLLR